MFTIAPLTVQNALAPTAGITRRAFNFETAKPCMRGRLARGQVQAVVGRRVRVKRQVRADLFLA